MAKLLATELSDGRGRKLVTQDSVTSAVIGTSQPKGDRGDPKVGAVPTPEFEASCAARIAMAKKAVEVMNSCPASFSDFSSEDRRLFEAQIRDGNDAREEMIGANTGLVKSIASRYRRPDVEFSDLVQQGTLGLIRAVESYDPALGFRFSTYSVWWIRHEILSFIAESRGAIRIPKHVSERIREVERSRAELLLKTGNPPSSHEIANETSLSVTQVDEISQLNVEVLSLDQPISGEESRSLQDVIEDKLCNDPQSTVSMSSLSQSLLDIVRLLPKREQEIVRMRYGLEGRDACSYEEIAKKFGVTKNRIKWIESQVLQKLKHQPRVQDLRNYLDPS